MAVNLNELQHSKKAWAKLLPPMMWDTHKIIWLLFQSKGNLCKIFKLRKRSKLKKTKTKQLLSFLFLLHINYRCGSLGNFKTAITLHDLRLLWEICVCTVYIFLLSFKLSMFLSLSFITQYHYRLTKKNTALPLLVLNFISNYSYIKHRDTPKHVCPLTNNFNVWRIEECDVYKTN